MTAAASPAGLLSMRVGRAALIWLTPGRAYKLFWGNGAGLRYKHELETFGWARGCPVWGKYLLPLDQRRIPRLLRSVRGKVIGPGESRDAALRAFVERQLAAAAGTPRPASALVELGKLRAALTDPASRDLIDRIEERLSKLMLPAGPVHGDLHRGNIVEVDGRYFVIDCNRFNVLSAPLFDRIHFLMIERKLRSPLKWLALLSESEELIASAMDAEGVAASRVTDVALAYGANRLALEAFDARLEGRPIAKYRAMLVRLAEKFGGGQVGSPRDGPGE